MTILFLELMKRFKAVGIKSKIIDGHLDVEHRLKIFSMEEKKWIVEPKNGQGQTICIPDGQIISYVYKKLENLQ
jgi:hypothetical protein